MLNLENIKQALNRVYDYFQRVIQNFSPRSIDSWVEVLKIAAVARMLYTHLPTILRYLAKSSIEAPLSIISIIYSLVKNTIIFTYYPLYALSKTFTFIFPAPLYPAIFLVLLVGYFVLEDLYQTAYKSAITRHPNSPRQAYEAMKESLPIPWWYLFQSIIPALIVLTLLYAYPMLLVIAQNIYALPSSIHWLFLSFSLILSSLIFIPYTPRSNVLTLILLSLFSLASYSYSLISPVLALSLLVTPIARIIYYHFSNLSNQRQEQYQTLFLNLLITVVLALITYPLYMTPGPSIFSVILLKISLPLLFSITAQFYENRFARYAFATLSILSFSLPSAIALQLIQASLLTLSCYDMYLVSHQNKDAQVEIGLPSAIAFLLMVANILMYYNLAQAALPAIATIANSFLLAGLAIGLIAPPSLIESEKKPVFYGTIASIILDTFAFCLLSTCSLQIASRVLYKASTAISFATISYAQYLLFQEPPAHANTP